MCECEENIYVFQKIYVYAWRKYVCMYGSNVCVCVCWENVYACTEKYMYGKYIYIRECVCVCVEKLPDHA